MDITETLIVISVFYAVLMFFDLFFKSCMHIPYLNLLKGTGITVKLLQISWQTTAFNRLFLRWGHYKHLNLWFTWGLYTSLIFYPLSFVLLLVAMMQNFFTATLDNVKSAPSALIIEPLIPGINLPASEIYYYALSLILSSIIHEMGHALAAVKEDVHIVDVGVNILYILPVAYVNLNSEKLNSLNPWKGLKILCAGVWHNLVLSIFAYLLYCALPLFYSGAFHVNSGVFVKNIENSSPLLGTRGFEVGDIIKTINVCPVRDENSFTGCLKNSFGDKQGYCVSADVVHNLDESVPLKYANNILDCCEQGKYASVCFEYMDKNDGVLEIPPHVCLPAREIVENAEFQCNNQKSCPDNLHCIKAILDNNTGLFRITRENNPDVVYLGHPVDFMKTMEVSSFIPKYEFSKFLYPDIVMKFLAYIIVISTGLVLVNIIPCLFMDGQHITRFVLEIIFKDYPRENVRFTALFISIISTFLLIFHCIYTIYLRLS